MRRGKIELLIKGGDHEKALEIYCVETFAKGDFRSTRFRVDSSAPVAKWTKALNQTTIIKLIRSEVLPPSQPRLSCVEIIISAFFTQWDWDSQNSTSPSSRKRRFEFGSPKRWVEKDFSVAITKICRLTVKYYRVQQFLVVRSFGMLRMYRSVDKQTQTFAFSSAKVIS